MLRKSAAEKVEVKKEDRSRGRGKGKDEASEAGSKISSFSEDESPNCLVDQSDEEERRRFRSHHIRRCFALCSSLRCRAVPVRPVMADLNFGLWCSL